METVAGDDSIIAGQEAQCPHTVTPTTGKGDPKVNKASVWASGCLLCWGAGEFGQHGHGQSEDVDLNHGLLSGFGQVGKRVKYSACGASHSVVITGEW